MYYLSKLDIRAINGAKFGRQLPHLSDIDWKDFELLYNYQQKK